MFASASLALLAGAVLSGSLLTGARAHGQAAPVALPVAAPSPIALYVPQTPTIAQALDKGVLIVVSKASQRMQVYRDGEPWMTSPVSTGRRGHGTPAGVFPIMEKQQFHRSNIYSNAPMPFMQRLTRGGIAIHAGHLPGYPASHGCIRLPYGVARALFGLTARSTTTVVILNQPIQSDEQTRQLARAMQPALPDRAAPVGLAYAPVQMPATAASPALPRPPMPVPVPVAVAQARPAGGQTVQLAAAQSPQEAEARWSWLVSHRPDLGRLDKTVVPAVVGARRYFRLRASGADAFATCSRLNGAGIDCFRVL
ncbi:L,D-transpeptidase family protein [Novosphingobium sp.]|uniref:L,D-transpeptidase family protein n=1 Tax=Novosphingobium sp. TaxID=1874826 RepID=UPI003B51FF45